MMSPHCWAFLLLTLLKCVFSYDPCGQKKNVFAVEGENVILQVDEKEIKEISWIFKSAHIATTKLDNTIEIKNPHYKSKLYTEKNGSIGIAKVNMEDNGTYVASIFKKDDACGQSYTLNVYSNFSSQDLQIHHNMTGGDSCFITCAVKYRDVTTSWSSVNRSYKEMTSTLHLNGTRLNIAWVCTAANKVINASKIIEPRTLCHHGQENYTIVIILTIVFILLVILLAAVCAWCLRKKMKMMPCSTCFRETKPKNETFTEENPYYEILGESTEMTVGHKNKDAVESKETRLNTIYVTVKAPRVVLYSPQTCQSENFLAISS